jgi:hypothetical protein
VSRWLPVVLGLAGALAGGWLAGGWTGVGWVLIAVSGLLVALGLLADDGERPAPPPGPGDKTVSGILEYQKHLN